MKQLKSTLHWIGPQAPIVQTLWGRHNQSLGDPPSHQHQNTRSPAATNPIKVRAISSKQSSISRRRTEPTSRGTRARSLSAEGGGQNGPVRGILFGSPSSQVRARARGAVVRARVDRPSLHVRSHKGLGGPRGPNDELACLRETQRGNKSSKIHVCTRHSIQLAKARSRVRSHLMQIIDY